MIRHALAHTVVGTLRVPTGGGTFAAPLPDGTLWVPSTVFPIVPRFSQQCHRSAALADGTRSVPDTLKTRQLLIRRS